MDYKQSAALVSGVLGLSVTSPLDTHVRMHSLLEV